MVYQDTIKLAAHGKGASDITGLVSGIITDSKVTTGTCQLFVHSSRCNLLISDTANETTKLQTADFMAQLAPDDDNATSIIDSTMDAVPNNMLHAVMQHTLSFPVNRNKPLLGTWQGIYLWDMSERPEERQLTLTIIGE